MIKKFEEFNKEKMNEGFLSKIKSALFPSDEDIINKMRDKISDFNYLINQANQGDVESFIEYVDNCEYVLNKIDLLTNHLLKSYNENDKIDEAEEIENFIKYALNSVYNTWPKRFSFTSVPDYFVSQIKKILRLHDKYSKKYGTSSIEVKKFNRT